MELQIEAEQIVSALISLFAERMNLIQRLGPADIEYRLDQEMRTRITELKAILANLEPIPAWFMELLARLESSKSTYRQFVETFTQPLPGDSPRDLPARCLHRLEYALEAHRRYGRPHTRGKRSLRKTDQEITTSHE